MRLNLLTSHPPESPLIRDKGNIVYFLYWYLKLWLSYLVMTSSIWIWRQVKIARHILNQLFLLGTLTGALYASDDKSPRVPALSPVTTIKIFRWQPHHHGIFHPVGVSIDGGRSLLHRHNRDRYLLFPSLPLPLFLCIIHPPVPVAVAVSLLLIRSRTEVLE